MSIDLTITAKQDGTGAEDGMTLGELRDALETLRANGGDHTTAVHVQTSRAHRVRSISATVERGQLDHPDA